MFHLRRSLSLSLALLCIALAADPASAADPQIRPLPPLRQQAQEQQAWLARRLTEVLPALMREQGVDMWIVSMREYAEDPVFFSMVSPMMFAARRRTIWVFHDRGEIGLVRWALGGGSQGGLFEMYRS